MGVGHMRDSLGRTVDYLRLSVTGLCNYRCRYCMPTEGVRKLRHEDILSVEECVEAVRAAAACGIQKVRLTGGEPLVRRGILDICRGIAAIPEIKELCLTTNGSLLREGIAAAEAAGFTGLKLNAVLIGGFNDDEIGDFLALTLDHPWEVRFIELMPMGPCAGWEGDRFLSGDEVLRRFPALEPVEGAGVARRFRLPGAAGTVGLIIRVTADGKLKSCLHSREELPLRGLHGSELEEAIRRGIQAKPERHQLARRPSDTPRNMNEIGG